MTNRCQEDFDCYLRAVMAPENRAARNESLLRADDVLSPHLILCHNLGRLLPHGSPAIAQALERLSAASELPPVEAGVLRQQAYRLRARERAASSRRR